MNFYHDVLYRMYGTSSCNHIIKSCLITTLFNCVENDSPELLPMDVVMLMLELCIPTAYRLTNEKPKGLTKAESGIGCTIRTMMTIEEGGMVAHGIPGHTSHSAFMTPSIPFEHLLRDGFISIPFRVTAFDYESIYIVKQGVDLQVTNLTFR
eukprot:PhF_6_TR14898/c0_g1_i2/m.23240